jgi:hypothetical protein
MKKHLFLLAVGLFLVSASAFAQASFSGYMFGDYYYNVARDSSFNFTTPKNSASSSSAPGAASMQAFQLRRIYFTMDDNISDQFTSRFRLEADQFATPGITAPVGAVTGKVDTTKRPPTVSAASPAASNDELVSGKTSVFVKDAYLMWKNIFAGSNLIFGVQPTPAYDVSETAWNYRFLEKTIMDLRSIVSSRDLGISLKGNLAGNGMLNYWLMIGNDNGNVPENNKYKRYYAHVQWKIMTNLQATAYVDYKDAGDVLNAAKTALVNGTTTTEAIFVGYNEPFKYNLGFEAFMNSLSNGYTPTGATTLSSKNALGYTVYGSYNFIPELAIVLRYDNYDPNTGSDLAAKGDSRNYVIGGLSWKVDKNVSISPNILYETYETETIAGKSISVDASVTARLTLYYVFL